MEVTRYIKHHVNMGNYEWAEVASSVKVEIPDDAENPGALLEKMQRTLDDSIREDLRRIWDCTSPDEDFEPYIKEWPREEEN